MESKKITRPFPAPFAFDLPKPNFSKGQVSPPSESLQESVRQLLLSCLDTPNNQDLASDNDFLALFIGRDENSTTR